MNKNLKSKLSDIWELHIKPHSIFILIFIGFFALLSWEVNELAIGIGDWNTAVFGNIVRQSLETNSFKPIFSYWNHPFLIQVFFLFSAKIFGLSEFSLRIVPIVFSLGNIALLYRICLNEFTKKIANIVSFLFSFTPMIAYYGRMVCHETICLFFILLTFCFYLKHLQTMKLRFLISMYFSFILGNFVDWPSYFVVGGILFHALFFKRNKKIIYKIGLMFILGIISFLGLSLIYSYVNSVDFSEIIKHQFSTAGTRTERIAIFPFVSLLAKRSLELFSSFLLVVVFVFYGNATYTIIKDLNNVKNSKFSIIAQRILSNKKIMLSFAFIIPGIIHIIFFSQGAFRHEYWLYYVTIGLVLPAALFLYKQKQVVLFLFLIGFFVTSFVRIGYLHIDNDDPSMYKIGLYIDNRTNETDYIIVPNPQIGYYAHCNFYRFRIDANLTWLNETIYEHQVSGTFIQFVVINILQFDSQTLDSISFKLLDYNYSKVYTEQYIIYELN
ncbi:MAG: ArnT family glycosyltransferase [Candidatus Heimdallarchaeaceae archaeon]